MAPGQTKYLSEILRDTGLLACAGWLVWHPSSLLSLDRATWEDRP